MSGKSYILCVDDEQAVLNQLSAQLVRKFGATHLVECTESAEEALALIDEISQAGDQVQLVICDQVMPGMKGDRFLETVNRERPEIMKVLLTGQAGLESAIYAINNAGLHRYIEKPWEAEDLNLAVDNLLTQYRLRADLTVYHGRLERRSHELHSLHQVGLGVASAVEPDRILAVVADAACNISGARAAAVVAQVGKREARWGGTLEPPLGAESRPTLEAALARLRAERRLEAPPFLPPRVRALVVERAGALFGWMLLLEAPDPSQDTLELLGILAGQAAESLNNLQLVEERLESERLSTIGRMISTIVHDFRNPMTAMKGYAGMFEEFDLPTGRQREYARLIIEEADRMSAMVDEILEFTRGERSQLDLSRVTVEELASKVRRLMEPEFRAKAVAFTTDLGYAGPLVADVDRLKRAILNIASNALDAMDRGGTFTMTSRLADGKVEIRLSDTGRGIPEEVQPRIFEPFFTHGKPRGIGLGMSITRKIVEDHGGEIVVESRLGAGTCFMLLLPLEPPPGGAAEPQPAPSGGATAAGS